MHIDGVDLICVVMFEERDSKVIVIVADWVSMPNWGRYSDLLNTRWLPQTAIEELRWTAHGQGAIANANAGLADQDIA